MSGGGWPLLALVLVGGAMAFAVGPDRGEPDRRRAHDILRQRLAAGELDPSDYRERAVMLGPERATNSSPPRWLPAVLAVTALLVLFGLAASGTGGARGWWGSMAGHMSGVLGQRNGEGVAPEPVAGAEEVTVEMTEMAFTPAALEFAAGEPVNLALTNIGGAFHDLTIDALDVRIGVASGETVTAGLEIDEPGVYSYYCSVPGHAAAGMQGTFTATAP